MADYKEQTVTGTSWHRAWQILIANPLGGIPTVRYDEEQVINLDSEQIRKSVEGGGIGYTIDPLAEIKLRDPETLELTGETIPVATVHVALLSDYINRALARDSAVNLIPPVVEPAPEITETSEEE
jgi:hypothetical protein